MSLRILFITNMWPDEERPWHGPFVKRQADSLVRLGVDLDVIAIRGYAGRGAYAKASARVAAMNRAVPHDLIHAHYGHSGIVARLQLRAPTVLTYWGSDLLGKATSSGSITLKSRIEAATFRQLAHAMQATITQSQAMEAVLPPSTRARNHVLPAGIELDRFAPLPRDEARRHLGWDLEERVILFAGDPGRAVKNHPLAEAAVARVAERLPDARLRVAWGNPPDAMPVWMSAADVLLLPSRSEGSPNVVKEAMASELAVVATAVGDVEELIAGLPGCHVCAPDPDALAGGLLDALAHGRVPQARAAVAHLGMAAVAGRTVAIYDEVLRGRARRTSCADHSPQRSGD